MIARKDFSDDASVVVFKVDNQEGLSATDLRASISRRVKESRAQVEKDKGGVCLGQLQFDSCYRPGTKVRSSMLMSNQSNNPIEVTAVSWLNKTTELGYECSDTLPLNYAEPVLWCWYNAHNHMHTLEWGL